MSTLQDYGVDSIHINIGQGDGAIHLLVKNPGATRPLILGASLIDGGKGAGFRKIKDSIAAIIGQYQLPSGAPNLQFDSVVITHWDVDHYKGVLDLINDDMQAQIQDVINTQGRTPTPAEIAAMQCRYFKYQGTGRTTLLTTFYAPYWEGEAKSFTQSQVTSGPKRKKTPNDRPAVVEENSTGRLDFRVYAHSDGRRTKPKPEVPGYTFAGLCNLCYRAEEMIGVNFFDNKRLNVPNTSLTSRSALVANIDWSTALVGAFCVGCFNIVIGSDNPTFNVKVVPEPNDKKNWPSIAAIVLWKDERVSHYFAGDAWDNSETRIAAWINSEVPSMKLSHHGSWTSTPIPLLNTFKPKTMVISAGSEYGHPTWGTLIYLNTWLWERPGQKPLLATCYPYYSLRDSDAEKFPNISWVANYDDFIENKIPVKPERRQFFQVLADQYTNINNKYPNNAITDLRAQAIAWHARVNQPPSRDQQVYNNKAWMAFQVESAWQDSLSQMYQKGPSPTTDRRKVQTDYIIIRCRSDVQSDGKYTVYFPTGPAVFPPQATVTAAAQTAQATSPVSNSAKQFDDIQSSLLALGNVPPPRSLGRIGEEDHLHVDDLPSGIMQVGETFVADTSESGYWFASSMVQQGENVTILDDGPLNDFVSSLHNLMFGVESEPAPSSQTAFLADDEWFSWLSDAVSATSFEVKSDTTGSPSGFVLQLNWPGNGLEGDQAQVRFDTDFIPAAFKIPTEFTPVAGLLGDTNVMLLGLDSSQNAIISTDLFTVLTYAGLQELTDSLLVQILGPEIKLSLSSDPAKSSEARNGVWFEPGQAYRTTVRLQWDFNDLGSVSSIFDFLGGVSLTAAHFVTRRTSTWVMSTEDFQVVNEGEAILTVELKVSNISFVGSVAFSEDVMTLTMIALGNVFEPIVNWLSSELGVSIPIIDWLLNSTGASLFSSIYIRRLTLVVGNVDGARKVTSWSFDVEISLKIAGGATILLTYSSERNSLRGEIWFVTPNPIPLVLLPEWEESQEIVPISGNPRSTLDLSELSPDGVVNIPNQIPTDVTAALLEINGESIAFYGLITCRAPSGSEPVPPVKLDIVELSARYTFAGASRGQLQLALNFQVELRPPSVDEDEDPTYLYGGIDYDAGNWVLTASASPLNFGELYDFFDPEAPEEVMKVLGNIQLLTLDLTYNYSKAAGSDFTFDGVLLLGELELNFTYQYTPEGWTVNAILGATTDQATLAEIVQGISGDEEDPLPQFIGDIPVTAVDEGGAVRLLCQRYNKDQTQTFRASKQDSYLFFSAAVRIGVASNTFIEASFMQYRDLAWQPTAPAKRVLKASVIGLPAVDVPGIGNLTQPFDEMFYMWVQDSSPQVSTKNVPGLGDKEVQYINNALSTQGDVSANDLVFKDIRKTKNDNDMVIAAGSHFVLVLFVRDQRQVVIDYTFEATKGQQSSLTQRDSSGGSGGSSMTPYKKSVGPISISNIGFKYKNNVLSILLDASFLLGPIGFALLGFSLDIDLEGITIRNIGHISFSLSGLAVEFDRSPILFAGVFTYVNNNEIKYYAGGIVLTFRPYLFTAAGFYGEIKNPPFTSTFVFAKLEGPLVTLAFAAISGITGGFGYNSDMKFPVVENVTQFPLVSNSGVNSDIMMTLGNLVSPSGGGWFTIRNGSLWLAAGLKVTAFQTLNLDAVIAVSWNPSVKLGIFGVAVADIPKGTSFRFAHVELGILAVVDWEAGVMKFEAQLSPNSYIFEPNCHLTGGFALYYWFEGSPYAGDWVFTIGGFHRAFIRPSYYPNPPRLGISWTIDSNFSITGESYFAITPKACMCGGRLSASLRLGPLRAWFDAWADFLLNYRPFFFMADAGISVGVSCKVDLWIISFTITISIGARLHLEGPPLRGTVWVDFWVMSFGINFGPSPNRPPPASLEQFYELVLQSTTQQNSFAAMLMSGRERAAPIAHDKSHVYSCRSGLLEGDGADTETKEGAEWKVGSGTFSFAVSCPFAIGKATVQSIDEFGETDDSNIPETSLSTEIYSKPMQLTSPIESAMNVTIKKNPSTRFATITEGIDDASSALQQWRIQPLIKAVPVALWGKYNRSEDPQVAGNSVGTLLNGNGAVVNLLMGAEILAPLPTVSPDKIGKFDAADASKEAVFSQGDEPIFPKFLDASDNWSPQAVKPGEEQQQWDKVSELWTNPKQGIDKRDQTVALLQEVMGWTRGLTAKTPTRLVSNFGNLYMAAPMISVA